MLVGAGVDQSVIAEHAVLPDIARLLRWYLDEFRRYLEAGETRLMALGYGFHDDHIIRMIYDAYIKRALGMYLVGPSGRRALNKQPPSTLIRVPDPFEQIPIVGEPVRPLWTTFDGDDLEHRDLLGVFR